MFTQTWVATAQERARRAHWRFVVPPVAAPGALLCWMIRERRAQCGVRATFGRSVIISGDADGSRLGLATFLARVTTAAFSALVLFVLVAECLDHKLGGKL